MNPKYPVFIPTKGRSESRMTLDLFDRLGIPYLAFVEEQELELYQRHIGREKLHVVPHQNKGLTVTRNYIWDFAESIGTEYFWTFDDNIEGLYRFNYNLKTPCSDGTPLAVIEQFAERYENLVISGMNYFMFATRKAKHPPYVLNTRVYSNMLIKTDARDSIGNPYRNVTFYNDDTDLCLRVLKDGWCTCLFNAFLIGKKTTMTVKGGMTDYYNKTDKRREFAEELKAAHPDCVEVVWKWDRWHHQVDYSRFKKNKLQFKPGVDPPDRVNNYGMVLQQQVGDKWVNIDRPA